MKALLAHVHQKYAYQPRLQVLTDCFAAKLESGDRVLDVGCGSGILGAALARHLPGLVVEGVETSPRGGEPIRVHAYPGGALPFSDESYDVVILADVLHHDRDPLNVLKECARVASRRVIVKDHLKHGWVSYLRISTLDWAANQPYGVDCLYTYWTREEWNQMFVRAQLVLESFRTPLRLYHPMFDWLFGGNIHFIATLKKISHGGDR